MENTLLIVVSLVLSAFFAGTEIAFNSSNRLMAKIDSADKSLISRLINLFYKHSGQFISTMLVGVNIVLVVYSIAMADIFEPLINRYITNNTFFVSLIQTVVGTIIVIFIGEFIPKAVFRNNSNFWLRLLSPITAVFYIVLYPISKLSTLLSVGLFRIFGVKISTEKQTDAFDRVDLSFLVEETLEKTDNRLIDNEIKIFKNALDFSSIKLRECIIPRNEVVALDIDLSSLDDLRATFSESGYSKIPIYKGSIDNIIGYIHSSDLFVKQDNWRSMIRKISVVPETMPAQRLMHLLLKDKKSIAVVIDEFGGTAGIVTLEDIMEEIFGEIEDEYDMQEYTLKRIGDGEYLLSGRLEIDTINRQTSIGLPESEEYVTLAGFLLHYYQRIPKLNDSILIDNWSFKVEKATNNRIELVRLTIKE